MHPIMTLCSLIMALLAFASPGYAQHPPDAHALLKRVEQTYRGLRSYYVEGDIVATVGLSDKAAGAPDTTMTQTTSFIAAVRNPDQVRGEMRQPGNRLVVLSNGEQTWHMVLNTRDNEYTVQIEDAVFRRSERAYEYLTDRMKAARTLRTATLELEGAPVECTVIRVEYERRPELKVYDPSYRTFWIEPMRGLVLQEESDAWMISNGIVVIPFGGRIKTFQATTMARVVRVNESLPDSLFVFTPPAGAKQVETLFKQKVDLSGTEALDFALQDLDGRPVTLREFRGQVVLLDFWATWCAPCRAAMPMLERLHQEFKAQGLVMLGVDDEPPDTIRAFVREHRSPFPTLVDVGKSVYKQYRIEAIPTTLLIDREGQIVLHTVGWTSSTKSELRAALRKVGIE